MKLMKKSLKQNHLSSFLSLAMALIMLSSVITKDSQSYAINSSSAMKTANNQVSNTESDQGIVEDKSPMWLLEKGYITISEDQNKLIRVDDWGRESIVYEGKISNIWLSFSKLFFVNTDSLAVMAMDLKTLKCQTVYYINDLNIAHASGDDLVMGVSNGLLWIDLITKSETLIQGRFSKVTRGEKSLYGIDENNKLCQIGLNGKVIVLGNIGEMDYHPIGTWIYTLDPETGKLKATQDTLSYRAVSDHKVAYLERDSNRLFYFEENAPTTLKWIQPKTGKAISFKTPFPLKAIELHGTRLLARDSHMNLWKIDLSVIEKAKENSLLEFKPLLSTMAKWDAMGIAEGILTFRGGPLRQNSAFGSAEVKNKALKLLWQYSIPAGKSKWAGGAGWTGQPLLIRWPQQMKTHMNISQVYKDDPDFVEVIQASLNGNVYFVDMTTGKATRPPIQIGNPIKGTPSLDSRGLPLLYVGDGIPCKEEAGFRLFSLIDQRELFFQKGIDLDSSRRWPSFDSSAFFNTKEDQLIVGGENGILYQYKLNTHYDDKTGALTVKPTKKIFKAKSVMGKDGKILREGIENSVAFYNQHYYFATNSGQVRCVDQNMKLLWEVNNYDDTDASVSIDIENGSPVIYTACEVDLQGEKGLSRILKIDGVTGKVIWRKSFTCYSKFGESPSNGGALASNIVGQNDINHMVIFTLSRCEKPEQGSVIAFDKKTGKQIWRTNMNTYAWSSPVAIYDQNGKSYILQNDHSGTLHLFEGTSGKEIWIKKVDTYLESTPAVYNNTIVFTSRTGTMYGFKIF